MSLQWTENAVLASVIAKGKTIIENAAREPEVQDLCNFLNVMGAKISNIGKKTIIIVSIIFAGIIVVIGSYFLIKKYRK